jgi:ribonuclease BN (tRNA processing enzyme)
MAMRLHFLGTTGYHPNDRRQTACLMLPEAGVVLDAGTGLYRARALLQTDELSIFLTHAHLDHSIGLTFLFDVLRDKPVERVRVFAEPDKITALREHLFHETLFPALPPIDFCPLAAGSRVELPQKGRLKAFSLPHPGGSLGFRLDWPEQSMAYITDTTADVGESYVAEIDRVHLLVHECYFPDGDEQVARTTGHSCLTPVVKVARQAHVGTLALVHTNPLDVDLDLLDLTAGRRIFPRIIVPDDGESIDF